MRLMNEQKKKRKKTFHKKSFSFQSLFFSSSNKSELKSQFKRPCKICESGKLFQGHVDTANI